MSYTLVFSPKAQRDLEEWKHSGQTKTLQKIFTLLQELSEHPTTGTGQVERLRGDLAGYWSRRIDKKSRLIYEIKDKIVTVTILSLLGHYSDR